MEDRPLKICEFNLENLFISMEYYDGQNLEKTPETVWREMALSQLQSVQKPLAKVWGVAEAIRSIDPDILMLVEVGGAESLSNLNRHFLGDRFVPYFVEGNSRRNIDLGFLVRKDLGYQVQAKSNRDTPVEVKAYRGNFTTRFSRDVAELHISDDAGLRLILLLVHLKSKISTDQDSQGKDVRTAEAVALTGLYEARRSEFPEVPIIVGGDFNTTLGSLEVEVLNLTDLVDFHEVLNTPVEDRITLTYFDYAGTPHHQTLDYLLISPHLTDRLVPEQSFTFRYKTFYEMPDEKPKTVRERYQMPSDHYPVVLTVNI